MLNCFLFEKFYLHYTLCDFDSILLHYAKLFIRQSIDHEQIFDVTFENPPHWKILRTPLDAIARTYREKRLVCAVSAYGRLLGESGEGEFILYSILQKHLF